MVSWEGKNQSTDNTTVGKKEELTEKMKTHRSLTETF